MSGSAASRPAQLDRRKLVRCLEMLGSAHEGEALNAALAAHRQVRSAGLVWADVIGLPPPPQPEPYHPAFPDWLFTDWPHRWRWVACACLESGADLRDRDRTFLRNMAAWASAPTPAQLKYLRGVADRLLSMAAAA